MKEWAKATKEQKAILTLDRIIKTIDVNPADCDFEESECFITAKHIQDDVLYVGLYSKQAYVSKERLSTREAALTLYEY